MPAQEIIKEVAGIVMTLCFMFCYIPQIVKIFKNMKSGNISIFLAERLKMWYFYKTFWNKQKNI